jgi:hypothetical protein
MTALGFPPFVGGLWVNGEFAGSAFVCSLSRALVSCAHCLPVDPVELAWQPLASEEQHKLEKWEVVYRNLELDVVVVVNSMPLVPPQELPDLPRDPQTLGIDLQFSALIQTTEKGVVLYQPDSGDGKFLGPRGPVTAPLHYRMKSAYVTPGCSGAPVLHYSHVGPTIVGMISGRYNSDSNWNRDSVWVVTAENLRNALKAAQARLIARSVYESELLVTLDLEPFLVPDSGEPSRAQDLETVAILQENVHLEQQDLGLVLRSDLAGSQSDSKRRYGLHSWKGSESR